MNSDSAFYIGTTHNICEDYAISRNNYISLSDGCSSSPNTDIGSRIICECSVDVFLNTLKMSYAINICKMMNLPYRCLDVTLLESYVRDDKIIINAIGDGNIVIKSMNGTMYVISIDYARSAPYYMSYTYSLEDNVLWDSIQYNLYTIRYSIITENKILEYKDYNYSFSKEIFIPNCEFSFSPKKNNLILNKEDIEWVALSSDGIQSFYEQVSTETSRYNRPISYIDVIKELLKIKNVNGRFVQRRLNRFRKNCKKKNWCHADDISLAVLSLKD